MNKDYLATLLSVLAVAAPTVRAFILTKFTPSRVVHITQLAQVAVQAAEKMGEDLGATGAAKLNFASTVVVDGAKRLGIHLSQDEVLAFVHTALRALQQAEGAHPAAVA